MSVYVRILDEDREPRTERIRVSLAASVPRDGLLSVTFDRTLRFVAAEEKYAAAYLEFFDVDTEQRMLYPLSPASKVRAGDLVSMEPDQFSITVPTFEAVLV